MDPLRRLREESGQTREPAGSGPSALARLVGERTEALQREIGQLRERAVQLQRIYDQSPLLIGSLALQDDALYLLSGSNALATLFGAPRESLAARPLSTLGIDDAAVRAWLEACRNAERLELPQHFVLRLAHGLVERQFSGLTGTLDAAAGEARTFWFTLEESDASGESDRPDDDRAQLLEALIEGSPVGVQLFDRAGTTLRMNAMQRALFGLPELSAAVIESAGTPPTGQPALTLLLERRFFPLTDRAGALSSVLAFTADVSQRVPGAVPSGQAESRLTLLTETMADGLIAFEGDGRISYANAAAERLLGSSGPQEPGASQAGGVRLRLSEAPFAALAQAFQRARAAGTPVRDVEFVVEQQGGGQLTLSASVAPLRAEDGGFAGAVAVLSDISARRDVEEALRAEAIRDQLTGLYNRRYMEESLRREIHGAERRGSPLTVVMLDIDNFKRFNDEYGHAAGDLMLRSIGAYLQQHIRAGDIACRYGGEELTLIFPDTSIEDTRRRVDGLRQQLRDLRITYRDRELSGVALSAGIAGMPNHGDTPEVLLRVADEALYRAKATGRDRVVIGEL